MHERLKTFSIYSKPPNIIKPQLSHFRGMSVLVALTHMLPK